MQTATARRVIPGTPVFDGDAAQKGYAINAMCFSFNDASNRQAFVDDEDAYCAKFKLTCEQREAVAAMMRIWRDEIVTALAMPGWPTR